MMVLRKPFLTQMMQRAVSGLSVILIFGVAFAVCNVFAAPHALADTPNPFTEVGDKDWANAWINHLFHNAPLPDNLALNFATFDTMIQGLHQAMGLYSYGMLFLAVMLLFYHLVSIVIETAHTGVAFGKRMNSIWAPIRLIVAIGLLVPISGGLSSGQYLVIKIAEEGSRMASNAWRTIMQSVDSNLYGLVMPHMPDVGALVTAAMEMELCRQVYDQLYAPVQNDAALRLLGPVGDATKIPADRLSGSIWRYSNALNGTTPLCGEYRFAGYRPPNLLKSSNSDVVAAIANDLSNFAVFRTTNLMIDAQGWAVRNAPMILAGSWPQDVEARNNLQTAENIVRTNLYDHLHTTLALESHLMEPALVRSAEGGWIAAGLLIPEMVRLQESYGELVDNALPASQEPIFAHPMLVQQTLSETLKNQWGGQDLDKATLDKLSAFYSRISHIMAATHAWLYSSQLVDNDFIAPSNFDLRDRLTLATPPEGVFALFAHAIDTAALAHGVWGVAPSSGDTGYPFVGHATSTAYNPLAMLGEFGRRQYQLGLYLMGLAGQSFALPNALAPAVFAGLGGLSFVVGAWVLIFIVPFLIFFRFLFAALTWMLNLFEAVIAMPIVALAHLTPTGEGLSGGTARQAYILWISLMLRPLLTLMGLVVGLVFFAFALSLLCAVLSPFAQSADPGNSGLLITLNVALILLFDVMMYAIVNASFKGIHFLPDQALRWISHFVVADHGASANTGVPLGAPYQGGPMITHLPGLTQFLSHKNAQQLNDKERVSIAGNRVSTAQKSAHPDENHRLKKALFPTYREPTPHDTEAKNLSVNISTPGVVIASAQTSVSTTTLQPPTLQPKFEDKKKLPHDAHAQEEFLNDDMVEKEKNNPDDV